MTEHAQRWMAENGLNLCRGIVQASIGPITAYCIPELALLLRTMLLATTPHTLRTSSFCLFWFVVFFFASCVLF